MVHSSIRKFAGLLCLVALLLAGAVTAQAAASSNKLTLTYKVYFGNGETVSSNALSKKPADLITPFSPEQNRQYYLVLPGTWNTSSLRVFFTGTKTIAVNGKTYKSGDKISLTPGKAVTLRPAKGSQITLHVMKTGGIPAMFIKTQSGSLNKIHADKTYNEPGTLYMTDAKGRVEYNGKLEAIRLRGNATQKYDKKPYQIKLEKGASLAGMKKDKTWILLANALDRSQIRNSIALDLARYSGAFAYTPSFQSVDLYVNHDYKGTYLLTEKVEIDSSRLKITNLEKTVEKLNPKLNFAKLKAKGNLELKAGGRKYYNIPLEPRDITGGYLVQANVEMRYETEASAFVTKQGFPFTMQEPKYASKNQINYVANLFQKIENALFSKNGVDPSSKKHYSDLLDMNSFVHRYLLAEVVDDYDGQRSFFYKDVDRKDPKVYVGPVWDQDNILGTYDLRKDPSAINISTDKSYPYYWFTRATKLGDFRYAAIKAYQGTYKKAINILLGKAKDEKGILKSIDEYAKEVRVSARLDLIRWPNSLRNTYNYINRGNGKDFDGQIAYLKSYLTKRKAALDKAFSTDGLKGLTPHPTKKPTPAPTKRPTPTPTPIPLPTAEPAVLSTLEPLTAATPAPAWPQFTVPPELTATATPEPTAEPQPMETASALQRAILMSVTDTPAPIQTPLPTVRPTEPPTPAPTAVPTAIPTPVSTPVPTAVSTAAPTAMPTVAPTDVPTSEPRTVPTWVPTPIPMIEPEETPAPELTETPAPTLTPKPTKKPTPTPVPTINPKNLYTSLTKDMSHSAVYVLRLRLYQLGYLENAGRADTDTSYVYNSRVINAVKALEKRNGKKQTGLATPELQAFIYSDACKPAAGHTVRPAKKAAATPKPVGPKVGKPKDFPKLDEEGFLPKNSKKEYVYKNAKGGLWYYISNNLYIEIKRYEEHKPYPEWFETRVRMRGNMAPYSIFADGKLGSEHFVSPGDIARQAKAVLAISDDAYTFRSTKTNANGKQVQPAGVIVRNGKALLDKPYRKPTAASWPPLDTLAFLPDGDVAVYANGETTTKKLLAKGVKNSYSFGPILVRYGKETQTARYSPSMLFMGEHPRNAIGVYDKNDYLIITVGGRENGIKGVPVSWLTDKFLEKGVKTAFNLDGGGTSALVFMGEVIDKNESASRKVTSLIRFGTSDLVKKKK